MNTDELERLLLKIGITGLRRRGSNLMGLCPNHEERNPSWGIHVDAPHKHGCFSCGYKGTLVTLLLDKGWSLSQVEQQLGAEFNQRTDWEISMPKANLLEPRKMDEMKMWAFDPAKDHAEAMEYLTKRGIYETTVRDCKLMYDPKQQCIGFPWYWNRVLVGFTTRTIVPGRMPKATTAPGFTKGHYLYVPSKWLKPVEHIILVEGEIDALKVYQENFEVAAVGHGSFTNRQNERLKTLPVKSLVLFFDHDRHGLEMTQRVGGIAENYAKSVLCANYDYVARKADTKIDPGDMTCVRIAQAIRTAKRFSSWPQFSA